MAGGWWLVAGGWLVGAVCEWVDGDDVCCRCFTRSHDLVVFLHAMHIDSHIDANMLAHMTLWKLCIMSTVPTAHFSTMACDLYTD